MSIRFWAPGERLVPISFTRPWTCCMSMPGPRAGLASTCCSPTMTRHTKTLFLPARDNNWRAEQMRQKQMSDKKSTSFMQQTWIIQKVPKQHSWITRLVFGSPWPHRLKMVGQESAVSCKMALCLICDQEQWWENTTNSSLAHSQNEKSQRRSPKKNKYNSAHDLIQHHGKE